MSELRLFHGTVGNYKDSILRDGYIKPGSEIKKSNYQDSMVSMKGFSYFSAVNPFDYANLTMNWWKKSESAPTKDFLIVECSCTEDKLYPNEDWLIKYMRDSGYSGSYENIKADLRKNNQREYLAFKDHWKTSLDEKGYVAYKGEARVISSLTISAELYFKLPIIFSGDYGLQDSQGQDMHNNLCQWFDTGLLSLLRKLEYKVDPNFPDIHAHRIS